MFVAHAVAGYIESNPLRARHDHRGGYSPASLNAPDGEAVGLAPGRLVEVNSNRLVVIGYGGGIAAVGVAASYGFEREAVPAAAGRAPGHLSDVVFVDLECAGGRQRGPQGGPVLLAA